MEDNNQLHRFDNMVLLRNSPLFSGLAPSQLQRVVMLAKEYEFPHGDAVLEEGSTMSSLYIVKHGSCSIGELEFRAGDTVLEFACFLPNFSLPSELVARDELKLLSIEQSDIYELLLNNPATSVRIIEQFAGIIRKYSMEKLSSQSVL